MAKIELNPSCDLSECGLEDAALKLYKQQVYTLVVSKDEFIRAKGVLKKLHMETKDNIFSPYVNLIVNPEFSSYEWELHSDTQVVHSAGA